MRGPGVEGENFAIFCEINTKVNKLNDLVGTNGKKRRFWLLVSHLKSVIWKHCAGTIGN